MGVNKISFIGILVIFLVFSFPSLAEAGSCQCGRKGGVDRNKIECYQDVADGANCNKIFENFNRQWETSGRDNKIDHYFQCYFKETIDCDNIISQRAAGLVEIKVNPLSEDETVVKVEPVAPVLQINIPTIKPFTTQGLKANTEGYAFIPFIGQYFAGIYKWAVMIGGLVAAIMIIFGGFLYLVSRGNAQQIEEAKSRISGAIFGLALLLGSYAMLYLINPDLVQFKGLKIQVIEFKSLTIDEETEEESVSNGIDPAELTKISGDNIDNPGGRQANAALVEKLKEAAKNLQAQGISLYITDGYRTPEQQKAQIAKKCSDPTNAATCKPPVCMLKDSDPKNCPHTTGGAVDIWGRRGNGSCVKNAKECKTDMATDPCRKDPCQAAVIFAMQNAGFCNFTKEAWHFEIPHMSPCAAAISAPPATDPMATGCCCIENSEPMNDLTKNECDEVPYVSLWEQGNCYPTLCP